MHRKIASATDSARADHRRHADRIAHAMSDMRWTTTCLHTDAFADVEAEGTQEIPGVWSYRLQQVYAASEFESLGPGPWTITRVDWRVDATITEPVSYPSERWVMTMSTTSREPAGLQGAFAENLGDDEVTVVDGPVTLTSTATGPPEGPRNFDYGVDFAQPFTYDPSQGNLLMDLSVFNGEGPLWMDFTFAPSSTTSLISTVLLGVDSPVADLDPPNGGQWGGHIARFTVVPEPTGCLPLIAGGLAMAAIHRRRTTRGESSE